ncbi:histone deacetylase interacting domain-containing protein, putative [Eimeria tenella]|uniref:Histone deacetylase interacting domain-containing protein, putative n=1 Tax=Eimeria tenella TaxID=5802 RepID=U6KZC3_EIMTE|nr:histone deacetylase interacting domain-containing protein, putative [Eimeria tenella]CDJ40855.1 histone deacetylase interacting domain-containing protein, putative [Eimeria tenella]|eukprot:XP_013231605.1 histone deacetylase interacting domain-containing protein, putative [Eimeria tenella]
METPAAEKQAAPSEPLSSSSPPSDDLAASPQSLPCRDDSPPVSAEGAQGPPQAASPDQATSDDFHLMWSELEAYLTKRFAGGPQSLVCLRRVLDQVKRQRLRVEELAFLIGHSFPDAPDVSLCMSLFFPDRTLIHAGNPAAAMCILIQNMAPEKYAIFNSILKSCMAQKTQRGSRDILLHRMQLLFRGHPLVIRAIRKLLVQQFCIEKNDGVIRKDQALELTKPFDDEPVQVHSVYRLAYQVGLSGGCVERARALASTVLHLVRMFLSKRLAFASLSDELDLAFAAFPSWFHVAGDIKRLVLTIQKEDFQTGKEIEHLVKLLAARNGKSPALARGKWKQAALEQLRAFLLLPLFLWRVHCRKQYSFSGCSQTAACQDYRVSLRHLCDLFLNGVLNQSVTLRLEVDHLIARAEKGEISSSLAMQRIASLLSRYPDCTEKLGVLLRLFRDIGASRLKEEEEGEQKTKPEKAQERAAASEVDPLTGDSADNAINLNQESKSDLIMNANGLAHVKTETPTTDSSAAALVNGTGNSTDCDSSLSAKEEKDFSEEVKTLAAAAADLLSRNISPCRFRSQELMIQLMSYKWLQPLYGVLDDWNAGRLFKDDAFSALEAAAAGSARGREALRRLVVVLEAQKAGGPSRPPLTRQQYDALPRNGSYRKLPEEWPASACSGRDGLAWQVLNDRWALFPDSSESQARYMNRHEEALLNLADSRYEWDLRVSSLESCLKRVEQIGKALARFPAAQRRLCTVRPSVFKQIHLSCLRRIFGPNTEQVLACVCAAPLESLEMVRSTLQCKLLQWRAMGELLGAYWTSLEQPHYGGAVDFRKRFLADKRGAAEAEELRAADGRDPRTKAARLAKNEA